MSTQSFYDLDEYNFLFVTLDCCRYDSFVKAKTPFLSSIGTTAKALTNGTYTLPAHMSFFMGYLPNSVDAKEDTPYYTAYRQLWRLAGGRKRALNSVGVLLDGDNVVHGFREMGYQTIGMGGVRWFRNKTLTSLFDEFHFKGPDVSSSVFSPRDESCFVLNDVDAIVNNIKKDKYFLFINCLETHVPYDTATYDTPADLQNIIDKSTSIWGCKKSVDTVDGVTSEDLKKLQELQVASIEYIDKQLEELCRKLPKKLFIVISGDHGESFGENGLWGHGIPTKEVMEVPLIIGKL